MNISIDESIIKTTLEHPFYVVDKGWMPAKYLNVGDKLLRNDGQDVIIESVSAERLSELQKVYNFEVADNHNHYVGKVPVLVHNDCGDTATTIGGRNRRCANRLTNSVRGRSRWNCCWRYDCRWLNRRRSS